MKERPILFNTPMVQAILRGDKTMTRRVIKRKCPYGKPGDRLWVRETWARVSVPEGTTARKILTLFKASMPFSGIDGTEVRWKPSIHMPRYVSRITLEVTDVRAERLNDISEEDAQSEGVLPSDFDKTYRYSFLKLWESIYGKWSWNNNPWVWVIEFKRI